MKWIGLILLQLNPEPGMREWLNKQVIIIFNSFWSISRVCFQTNNNADTCPFSFFVDSFLYEHEYICALLFTTGIRAAIPRERSLRPFFGQWKLKFDTIYIKNETKIKQGLSKNSETPEKNKIYDNSIIYNDTLPIAICKAWVLKLRFPSCNAPFWIFLALHATRTKRHELWGWSWGAEGQQ